MNDSDHLEKERAPNELSKPITGELLPQQLPANIDNESYLAHQAEGQGQSGAQQQPPLSMGSDDTTTTQVSSYPTDPSSGSVMNDSSAVMPQIADDVDLIEKEWVDKAKDIVNNTKNDPREQNKEMNHLKAEYLQRRYNKSIKVEE